MDRTRGLFGARAAFVAVLALSWLSGSAAEAATPPVPSWLGISCHATVNGVCYVNGSFTLSASSSGAHHYRWCRSNDITSGAGCHVVMSSHAGSTFTVSGSNLPSDGYRRAYRVSACDSAGHCTTWASSPQVVATGDMSPPAAPGNATAYCSHLDGDNCWVWRDVNVSSSPSSDAGSGISQYHLCRSEDVTGWGGCSVTVGYPATPSYKISGSHLPSDGYRRAYRFRSQDRVGNWSGWSAPLFLRVDRYAPTVSATNSSTAWSASRTATVTAADASGGTAANSGLAEVRYQWNTAFAPLQCSGGAQTYSGAVLTVPEGDNVLYLCAKDRTGRVGSWNGTYRVDGAPPTVPGDPITSCGYLDGDDCWVWRDFSVSSSPSSDAGSGIAQYQLCRSEDVTGGWGGCAVTVASPASPVYTVGGSHLPSDGYRRAYRFRSQDRTGNWSGWSAPLYVRIDRHAPTVSATNPSTAWFSSRTAAVSASDVTGGTGANSGIAEVRYRWNAPFPPLGCSGGTVTASGAVLTVPAGDNVLYLCSKDRAGRVGSWDGHYRVDATVPTLDSLTVSSDLWTIGDGSTYQITATASDGESGIRELRALINLQGDNSDNRRGNFSWRHQDLGYQWAADQVPCTGGGFASKRPDAFNPSTVTLVGCSSSLAGGQRTVTFTVRPEPSFGEFPANDISMWARDFTLNGRGWRNFELNFATVGPPPASLRVLTASGNELPDGASLGWGTVGLGSGENGRIVRSLTVANGAPAGSADLVLEGSPSNLELTGSSAFSIGGSLASPLAPGEEDGFQIYFDTGELGQHTAVLEIWHSDSSRPNPWPIELSGEVLATPTAASVTPDYIPRGASTTITVRGSNLLGASIYVATAPFEEGATSTRVFPTAELLSVNPAGTELTARVDALDPAIDGFYNLAIETSAGATAVQFRVVGPEPVVDAWTPSEPVVGGLHVLQIFGANLDGARIVPLNAKVLVVDAVRSDIGVVRPNDRDRSYTGLIFVSPDATPGELELRIDGTGGSTILPMELRADRALVSAATYQLDGEVPSGAVAPRVLLQEPIVAAGFERPSVSYGVPPGAELPSSVSRDKMQVSAANSYCILLGGQIVVQFRAILFSLLTEANDPLTVQLIEALLPGDFLDFRNLTLGLRGFLSFEFSYRNCNGITDTRGCVEGQLTSMIPGTAGKRFTFNTCKDFNQNEDLPGEGSVDDQGFATTNDCLQFHDLGGLTTAGEETTDLSGYRAGRAEVNCCGDARISLLSTVNLFGEDFTFSDEILVTDKAEDCCQEANLALDGDGTPPPECSVPPPLKVKDVSFAGDLTVKRDELGRDAVVISDPVWSDSDLDGQPAVANNGVAYPRGSTIRLTARLAPTQPSDRSHTVRVRASGPDGMLFESEEATLSRGATQLELDMEWTIPPSLPTRHYDPLILSWAYSVDGGGFESAGSTRHPFFITLKQPRTGSGRQITMTALSLGVAGGGAANENDAAGRTWGLFTGPGNVRGWDGRQLAYYPAGKGFGDCATTSLDLLETGVGQCGSFARLLIDALAVNGIEGRFTQVTADTGTGFLVQSWKHDGSKTYEGQEYAWRLELVVEGNGALGMVPKKPNDTYGDMISLPGLPGQSSPTPSEKAFLRHFIVTLYVDGQHAALLDPSYGLSFSSEAHFQNAAVAGFYTHIPEDAGNEFRLKCPPADPQPDASCSLDNITFAAETEQLSGETTFTSTDSLEEPWP